MVATQHAVFVHAISRDINGLFSSLRIISLCALLALSLLGCTRSEQSFLTVQGCLSDRDGVEMFLDQMRAIADAEDMRFVDSSESTAESLRELGHESAERTHGSSVIHIGILASDGMGVIAGNLGLPGYEIALGFGEGSDPEEARAFAARVMAQLGQHWQLEVVPPGVGATPKGNCP